jgi:Rod binding domain-containing protein
MPSGLTQARPAPSARPSTPVDPNKLWKAARDFEAMTLGEFLKPMFETVDAKNNLFGGGDAEKTWKPMMIDEIAKQIAGSGGLGLAAPFHDAMLRMQEAGQDPAGHTPAARKQEGKR